MNIFVVTLVSALSSNGHNQMDSLIQMQQIFTNTVSLPIAQDFINLVQQTLINSSHQPTTSLIELVLSSMDAHP